MTSRPSIGYELLARVTTLPIRILSSQATEEPEVSSHQLGCKIPRDDIEEGALALIFALAILSFHDARPRGNSYVDYVEKDEWTLDDLCRHLRFWKGALCLDTDYVRGRMMKTHVRVWPTGVVEIETINRHRMATRWVEALKGKKHLRLVTADPRPSP